MLTFFIQRHILFILFYTVLQLLPRCWPLSQCACIRTVWTKVQTTRLTAGTVTGSNTGQGCELSLTQRFVEFYYRMRYSIHSDNMHYVW